MNDDNNIAVSTQILLGEINRCTECQSSLPYPPRPILQASRKARILIAAQAPGQIAHDTSLPFNDPSGDRLRRWLGVERSTFYNPELFALIPMGFCFPGNGKSGDLAPRPECAKKWRQPLLASLEGVELTLVIGQYAQQWHLRDQHKTLTERVRNWRECWPESLPLPHPSGRNNRWLKNNPWFENEVIPNLQQRVNLILGTPKKDGP